MAGKTSKPSFFWQALLMLLPVVALATVSLLSLRRDQQSAESDARQLAEENVRSLARAMRGTVSEELRRFLVLQNTWMQGLNDASQPSSSGSIFPDAKLQADITQWEHDYPGLKFLASVLPQASLLADGRQIEPPELPSTPQPPKWFVELSPEQRTLWETLRAASNPEEINSRLQNFLKAHPSTKAESAAKFLTRPTKEIIQDSERVSPSESGISFEEIACYQILSATNAQLTDSLLQSVWWRVIGHPSIVSSKLLEAAGGLTNRANASLQQKFFWLHEYFAARSAVDDSLASLRTLPDLRPLKSNSWSHWAGDSSALAIFQATTFSSQKNDFAGVPLSGPGYLIWLAPRPVVEAVFNRAWVENQYLVPPYATAQVVIEDKLLAQPTSRAVAKETTLLSEAAQKAGIDFAQDAIRFDVKFFLTSRNQMLSTQRRRARLFGALILGAALTAFVGLLAARRAFTKQLLLNESKSNFVSSVSHELRAPIASVRLMAESLERGKVSEPQKQNEYFRFIVQECRRLSSLIENVLDFSRIEQGRKQYEFEPTDLLALTRETVKLMEPYAEEKGVRLEFNAELGVRSAELEVDGRAIQQALVNLIDNAIKHSAKGQVVNIGIEAVSGARREVSGDDSITAADLTPRASHLTLFVSDHGPGIAPAEHEKIFERFYRLGSELRRETQGVGIGLSIVKHIVEAHGGRVTVRSNPGEGSRFTIELPIKQLNK